MRSGVIVCSRLILKLLVGMEQRKTLEYVSQSWPAIRLIPKSCTESLYSGIDPSTQEAKTQTAYKWGFASNKSRVDNDALRAARESVGAATYGRDGPSSSSGPSRVIGPTLPSSSDLTMSREAAEELESAERSFKRKREKLEAKDRIEDMVGPKEVGREGMMEKKRARREGDRAFREKGDDGFVEADEKTLLGGGDSFKERYVNLIFFIYAVYNCTSFGFYIRIAQRDAARKRFEEKRNSGKEDKVAATRERAGVIKDKDKATMDMFQQMAKARFG